MWLLPGLVLGSATIELCHALTAPVYAPAYRSKFSNSKSRSISPQIARLLFAQKLGVSQYHELGDIDEENLSILQDFGDRKGSIFEGVDEIGSEKPIYIIEGIRRAEDILGKNEIPILSIEDAPDFSHNAQLVRDLQAQLLHLSPKPRDAHIQHITQLTYQTPEDDESYYSTISSIKTLLDTHPATAETLIILMPPSPKSSKSNKQNTPSPYGSYSMPFDDLPKLKQQQKLKRHPQKQQHTEEEPLEPPSSPPDSTPTDSTDSSSPTSTPSFSPLPKGILKICHDSAEAAVAETNNCSSHGTVILRSKFAGEGKGPDCWACKCGDTTTTTSGGGKKTIAWGGPACQKKDVSMPFWLLAGVTLGLVSAVAWGVGILVQIGSEDLPSVIGAGVVGASASSK